MIGRVLAFVFCVCSLEAMAAAGGSDVSPDKTPPNWRKFETEGLSFQLPAGDGWINDRAESTVSALRVTRLANGDPALIHAAYVIPMEYSDLFYDWIEPELALLYREHEARGLTAMTGEGGDYATYEYEMGEEIHGGRLFYTLNNLLQRKDKEGSTLHWVRQTLFVYFPPGYSENRRFFEVILGATCVSHDCTLDDLNLREMIPVLESFALK